ncbi:metallophosphatase [Balneolaceae bacterium ANBcel3]|nr:metallophosphatase [Balneolaceae bacterium ANBcel3]
MMDRRTFLKHSSLLGAGAGLGLLTPFSSLGSGSLSRVTILHTNDTHARIEPFPDSAPQYAGLGGVARRAALIKKLRAEHPQSLLLDAGDIFQGTPYFNKYHGALDLEVMTKMGYDASTIGNHEFDNGVDGFEAVMDKARFPFVISNYDFGTTRMGLRMQNFILRQIGEIRVGIFGLGIAFDNLVLPHLHKGVTWLDPFQVSADMVARLRGYHQCDMVICLSHLGYRYSDPERISDQRIANEVDGIDLIIGGHTHTFMEEPEAVEKENGSRTWISQVGFAGIVLGQMDFFFDRSKSVLAVQGSNYSVGPSQTA